MLTETDCTTILQNFLKRKNVHFKKFELRPISEHSEGFMGEHHKLLITHEVDNQLQVDQFFIKTAPVKNQAQLEMTQNWGLYKKELFVYEELIKDFEKCGFDTSFAGTSYYCIAEEALVMEDLTLKGFIVPCKDELLSLEQLKCAIDSLVNFHAAGFAYDQLKSKETGRNFRIGEEFQEYLKEYFFVHYLAPESFGMKMWHNNNKTYNKLLSLIEKDAFPGFKDLFRNYKFGKIFAEDHGIRKTLGHGDLWTNNLMFRYENNKPTKCVILDFQITRYFYPCFDVLVLIHVNTDAEFRKKHRDELFKYYFDNLRRVLSKYGCSLDEIHPWEDFLRSVKLVLPDALTWILMSKSITCLPKETLTDFVQDEGDRMNELIFDNSELVGHAFKTNEKYKKLMLEMIQDMYEALTDVTPLE